MLGCTENGVLNNSEFSKPLPWIGLYIVVGTFACTLAMAADVFSNFHHRKLWFPPKFFSLNATTLTLLATATKLAVDLNTSMPRRQDQLAKLSSTALICTVIANFMPSLATMGGSEIVSNIIALGILVITVIVNVCMQMGTGVIYLFLPEHGFILFFMLLLFLNLCSSALIIIPVKRIMEDEYDSKRRKLEVSYDNIIRSQLVADGVGPSSVIAAVMECVKKCWLMANTGNPSHMLGRSIICTSSGALCLGSSLVLMEASLRSFATDSVRFCGGTCDYKWSSTLIFFMQAIAVGVGTIAPAYRCFYTVNLEFAGLWIVEGVDWDELRGKWFYVPLPFQINSWRNRKIVYYCKNGILLVVAILQPIPELVSMFILFIVGFVILFICAIVEIVSVFICTALKKLYCRPSTSNEESRHDSNEDLTHFVLAVEVDTVELMMRSGIKYIDQWIERGRKKQPTNLIKLITEHSTENFKGVLYFDSNKVPSLPALEGFEEPSNCWALPVVTLTGIAIALSYFDQNIKVDSLVDAVSEGLRYVRLVDKHLDGKWLARMREVAEDAWQKVDQGDEWYLVYRRNEHLQIIEEEGLWPGPSFKSLCSGNLISMLEGLADHSERNIINPHGLINKNGNLACTCLYRVTRTILKDNYWTTTELFQFLRMTISDILGACLTNLPRTVYSECIRTNGIKAGGEENVRGAALLLLEAEGILRACWRSL